MSIGGLILKKLFFTVGIIIILVGSVVASGYSYSSTATKTETVNSGYNIWEVSGNYGAGETLLIGWRYAQEWTKGLDEPEDDAVPVFHKHIWWEIDDPSNSTTEFNTAFTSYGPSGEKLTGLFLCYINVTIRAQGLNVTAQYPEYIGGITLLNGTYTARCVKDFEPELMNQTAPYWLALEREYSVVEYPHTTYLPAGISIIGVGTVIAVAAARSKKDKTKKT